MSSVPNWLPRARLARDIAILQNLKDDFQYFVNGVNEKISQQKDAIKASFDEYAKGFLLEASSLTWSLRRSKVGQTGGTIEFASFEMDMTGSNFIIPHRRSGPEQVSDKANANLSILHFEWR